MSDEAKVQITGKEGTVLTCTVIKEEKVGTLWKVTVRCPDGREKSATSANVNQSRQLACMECDN